MTPWRGPAIALGLLLLVQAFWRSGELADPDVWWHLAAGERILDAGQLPRVDPFSWTAPGAPWLPHAWLSEVALALLQRVGGLAAISLFRALMVLGIGLSLLALSRRAGARPWPSVAVACVTTVLLNPFIAERPRAIGLLLFVWLLVLLRRLLGTAEEIPAQGPLRRTAVALSGLLLLCVGWVNLHGSFLVAVAVIGVSALGHLLHRTRPALSLIVATGGLLAGLVNPFGHRIYLTALNISHSSSFIEEWRPLLPGDPRDAAVIAFAVAVLWALWRTRQWRRLELALPLAALAALTVVTVRGAPFLLIAGAPVVATAAGAISAPRLRAWAHARSGPLVLGVALAWAALVVMVSPTVTRVGRIASKYPARAVAAIPRGCTLLNEYELGAFVIYARWPAVRVSMDGRNDVYGTDRIIEQRRLLESTDVRGVERLGARCVLLRRERPLASALAADAGWRPLAREGAFVLYQRRAAPNR